jgi:uncharacterized protein DUF4843
MKRIKYMLGMLAIILLASCEKEVKTYDGPEAVYFAQQWGTANYTDYPYRPYTTVELVKVAGASTEYTAKIKVMFTGIVKNYDRYFKIEINPDSTTAVANVHYAPLPEEVLVAANATEAYIPVVIKRTKDLQTTSKRIGLRLVANNDFGIAFPVWKAIPNLGTGTLTPADTAFDNSLHTVVVNDFIAQPAIWRGSVNATTNRDQGSWGGFTRKKIELMSKLFNLTYDDFASDKTLTPVLASLITLEMRRYLLDQFNAGTPVKEEDGRLMWVDGVSWVSTVGVPYP